MLKGISPLISPELLKTIAQMGHGDELVIGDANFPAASMNPRCIRADGLGGKELLDAILQLFPLDQFVETPVILMGADLPEDPLIWAAYQEIVHKYEPNTQTGFIGRFEFYDRSREAFATVQTGETALYACVILKKGVIS